MSRFLLHNFFPSTSIIFISVIKLVFLFKKSLSQRVYANNWSTTRLLFSNFFDLYYASKIRRWIFDLNYIARISDTHLEFADKGKSITDYKIKAEDKLSSVSSCSIQFLRDGHKITSCFYDLIALILSSFFFRHNNFFLISFHLRWITNQEKFCH